MPLIPTVLEIRRFIDLLFIFIKTAESTEARAPVSVDLREVSFAHLSLWHNNMSAHIPAHRLTGEHMCV